MMDPSGVYGNVLDTLFNWLIKDKVIKLIHLFNQTFVLFTVPWILIREDHSTQFIIKDG